MNNCLKISRSDIEQFINCEKCFYLDKIYEIKRPPTYPYLLNSAVDILLKNEFDYYRKNNKKHPYFLKNKLDFSLYNDQKIKDWRKFNVGINYLHKKTGFILRGSIDDIWIDNKTNELILVEYKSTSKLSEVNLDSSWQIAYKRQVEFYQYIMHKNNFNVSKRAFFVYCNGLKNKKYFNEKLDFEVKIIEYEGHFDWIEKTLIKMSKTVNNKKIPDYSNNCSFCNYLKKIKSVDG